MRRSFLQLGLRTLATLARITAGLGMAVALLVLAPLLLLSLLATILLFCAAFPLAMGLIMASRIGGKVISRARRAGL
jgi:hypothetical protein